MRTLLIGHFILALLVGVPCAQAQAQPQITLTHQGNTNAVFTIRGNNYNQQAQFLLTLTTPGLPPNQAIDYLTISFSPVLAHANTLDWVSLNHRGSAGIGAQARAANNWTG